MTAGIVTLSYGSVSDGRRAWKTRRKSRPGVFGLFATCRQYLSTTKSWLGPKIFPLCLKFSRLKAWTARSRWRRRCRSTEKKLSSNLLFLLIGLQLTLMPLLICTWSAQAAKMTSLDVFGFDPTCPDSDDEPITDVEDWVPYKYFTIIIMANPYQISNIGHINGKLINVGRNLNQMDIYM